MQLIEKATVVIISNDLIVQTSDNLTITALEALTGVRVTEGVTDTL